MPALALTILGQANEWLVRAVYEWGTLGAVLIAALSAASSLIPVTGVLLYWSVLWGFAYPNSTLLRLAVIPALAVQPLALLLIVIRGARR